MKSCQTLNWALEYHTLILFSYRNHYEKKSILFSPWLLQRSSKPSKDNPACRLADQGSPMVALSRV